MPATSGIVPCLWFDGQAETAAAFYVRTFPNARVTATLRYPEAMDNPAGKPRGSVLMVAFEVDGQPFTTLNGGPQFVPNPAISFFAHVETPAEADRLYSAFADGGQALMPLDAYPWSERYAWVQDRFGVSWQVITGRRPPGGATIVPCLMFSGKQHGRAAEAARVYSAIFPGGRVGHLEFYATGEGPEGTVKHGRFVLDGREMIAMDSHLANDIAFNEAVSLQVMCRDQAEVDHYWAALGEGGEPGPCGWLKDRFGLSWQVVPSGIERWLTGGDAAARHRAFQAMLGMTKLDVAALQQAFEGR